MRHCEHTCADMAMTYCGAPVLPKHSSPLRSLTAVSTRACIAAGKGWPCPRMMTAGAPHLIRLLRPVSAPLDGAWTARPRVQHKHMHKQEEDQQRKEKGQLHWQEGCTHACAPCQSRKEAPPASSTTSPGTKSADGTSCSWLFRSTVASSACGGSSGHTSGMTS